MEHCPHLISAVQVAIAGEHKEQRIEICCHCGVERAKFEFTAPVGHGKLLPLHEFEGKPAVGVWDDECIVATKIGGQSEPTGS